MKKRLLSIFLVLAMVLTMLPTAAFATENVDEDEPIVQEEFLEEESEEEPVEESAEPAEEPAEEPTEEPTEEPAEEPAEVTPVCTCDTLCWSADDAGDCPVCSVGCLTARVRTPRSRTMVFR